MLWVAIQAILLGLLVVAPGEPLAIYRWLGLLGYLCVAVSLIVGAWALIDLRPYFAVAPQPRPDAKLYARGLYKYVRHPMYSAVMLFSVGYGLLHPSLIKFALALVIIVFFWIKSRHEERLLSKKYPQYEEYKKTTKAFIPKFIRR